MGLTCCLWAQYTVAEATAYCEKPHKWGYPVGLEHYTDSEILQPGLTSNYGEFALIELWIMHSFPDTQKLNTIPIS